MYGATENEAGVPPDEENNGAPIVGGATEGAPLLRGSFSSTGSAVSGAGTDSAGTDAAKMQFTSGLTTRALVVGLVAASINSAVNMYFNFRYAGGLGQYWVIVVSYVVLKWCDGQAWLPAWLNPPDRAFGAKEHCCATLTGAAAAFSQSLGLSGGLAPLTLYYGHAFPLGKIFAWTFIAAFFGLFLGCLYGKLPVVILQRTFVD